MSLSACSKYLIGHEFMSTTFKDPFWAVPKRLRQPELDKILLDVLNGAELRGVFSSFSEFFAKDEKFRRLTLDRLVFGITRNGKDEFKPIFFELLEKDNDFARLAIDNPIALRIKDSTEFTGLDVVVMYVPERIIIDLLHRMEEDKLYKNLMSEPHDVIIDYKRGKPVMQEAVSFDIAMVNLKNRGIDLSTYLYFAQKHMLLRRLLRVMEPE